MPDFYEKVIFYRLPQKKNLPAISQEDFIGNSLRENAAPHPVLSRNFCCSRSLSTFSICAPSFRSFKWKSSYPRSI